MLISNIRFLAIMLSLMGVSLGVASVAAAAVNEWLERRQERAHAHPHSGS